MGTKGGRLQVFAFGDHRSVSDPRVLEQTLTRLILCLLVNGGWKHIYVVPAPVMNGFFRKQRGATRAELFSKVDGDLEIAGPRYIRNFSSARHAARVPGGCDAFAKGELSDNGQTPFTYSSHGTPRPCELPM